MSCIPLIRHLSLLFFPPANHLKHWTLFGLLHVSPPPFFPPLKKKKNLHIQKKNWSLFLFTNDCKMASSGNTVGDFSDNKGSGTWCGWLSPQLSSARPKTDSPTTSSYSVPLHPPTSLDGTLCLHLYISSRRGRTPP